MRDLKLYDKIKITVIGTKTIIMEVIIMAQLIGFLVAMYLCIYLPWKANQKEESRKRQDMYNNLNKKSVDEMEKWRK